MIEHGP